MCCSLACLRTGLSASIQPHCSCSTGSRRFFAQDFSPTWCQAYVGNLKPGKLPLQLWCAPPMWLLFVAVVGVDPKSVVCEAFRHGQCTKGFKCKFSHDLNVSKKGPKIDIYSDRRDAEEEETMEDWDQSTLEDVVQKKHGKENRGNQTNIICKYFLEALEKKQYGWWAIHQDSCFLPCKCLSGWLIVLLSHFRFDLLNNAILGFSCWGQVAAWKHLC